MSEHVRYGKTPTGNGVLVLPLSPEACVRDWQALRADMARHVDPAFTRDEWAYLMAFLDGQHLAAPYAVCFGIAATREPGRFDWLARPRGLVALWLPNNVSLLGPLTMVLLSLSGSPVRIKGGTRGESLMAAFLAYARRQLPDGELKTYLHEQVTLEFFDHADPRHARMAAEARVRIVFGSDAAASAIHALPHPPDSVSFSFIDRRSEAWIEPAAATDDVLDALAKVFAVYGQAGCTSPRRVVLLDAALPSVTAFRDRLAARWHEVLPRAPEAHLASSNVMARQLAAAVGWDAVCTAANGAVLAVGTTALPLVDETMTLHLVGATRDQALGALPPNIQTLGHAFHGPFDEGFVCAVARSRIKRVVPIAEMHHFGWTWDGHEFWRGLFEITEFRDAAPVGAESESP